MTYYDICRYTPVNRVDMCKVQALAADMAANGWVGAPILTYYDTLLTGSHRLAALQLLCEGDNLDLACEAASWDVAEDVTEEVSAALEALSLDEIDYSDLGVLLAGTWVEMYAEQIREW